jgi:hypothetical protein
VSIIEFPTNGVAASDRKDQTVDNQRCEYTESLEAQITIWLLNAVDPSEPVLLTDSERTALTDELGARAARCRSAPVRPTDLFRGTRAARFYEQRARNAGRKRPRLHRFEMEIVLRHFVATIPKNYSDLAYFHCQMGSDYERLAYLLSCAFAQWPVGTRGAPTLRRRAVTLLLV